MIGTSLRLSALRIGKIAPTAPVAKEMIRPIRTGQRKLFRAAPALIWRVRYSRLPSAVSDIALIASLDIEIAHVTGCSMNIGSIELELRGGQVKPIAVSEPSTVHKPGDQVSQIYKLIPNLSTNGQLLLGSNEGYVLGLKIKGNVLVSKTCRPCISIEWRTNIDFAVDPNLSRAAQLSPTERNNPPRILDPDSLPSPTEQVQQDEPASKVNNVTVTISGPSRIQVGEIFHWDVFVVNRSDKTRKLAVLIIPKRKRDLERHRPQSSTSSIGSQRKDVLLASAVLDDNVIYAKQKNARIEPTELVCLTTDVRIG